ncbi:hypothetical protein F5878DRAFT_603225 [Lentinula raphanica]|uniref:Retrovirus-related Pol polyprotein from transposon TNT 1-94-like beta-barrel domain-containing protein n=1 Tax=Lentinula raphanica TaxID=153919 RepID=A0AA38PJ81_9AGAR|nr:hypothetical protein F5878DRAFT_603225 [Lentinula raphanica]
MQQIIGNQCKPDDDPVAWLDVMIRLPYPNQRPNGNRPSSFNPNLFCDNPFCVFAQGHTIDTCFVYGVLEKARGGRPTGGNRFTGGGNRFAGLSATNETPTRDDEVNHNVPNDDPPTYAGMVEGGGDVEEEEVERVIGSVEDDFAFMMDVSEDPELEKGADDEIHIDEEVKINAVALNLETPQNDSINHDTGATRHIFRERKFFQDYEVLETPIQVHGFGSNLSAIAVGKGTVNLQAKVKNTPRSFSISNVLYIPSARCNLISGSRLDKKGVKTKTGDGKITYYNSHSIPFAMGSVVRDLFRMEVTPVEVEEKKEGEIEFAAMVPDVNELFRTGSESEFAQRVGFTTV